MSTSAAPCELAGTNHKHPGLPSQRLRPVPRRDGAPPDSRDARTGKPQRVKLAQHLSALRDVGDAQLPKGLGVHRLKVGAGLGKREKERGQTKSIKLTMKSFLVLCTAAFIAAFGAPTDALTVWPKPQQENYGQETFVIDPTALTFVSDTPSDIIHDAFKRYRGIILLHSSENAASAQTAVAQGFKSISKVSVRTLERFDHFGLLLFSF